MRSTLIEPFFFVCGGILSLKQENDNQIDWMLEASSINEINLEEDRSNNNNSKTQFKMENKTKEQLLQELFKIKRSALDVETS